MKEKSQPIKLGLIGCGQAAALSHLPALQHVPEVEVVAVADVDQDRLERVAHRFHVKRCYAHYPALLQDPIIEAVAVCVPVQFHAEIATAVLDSGKHLFLEKPLALNLKEADWLIRRSAQSPQKVMLGFNLRWHRLTLQARTWIQQGRLGSVEFIRTGLTSYHEAIPEWRQRRALGGGVFFEQAVHHFDLWRFLLQSDIEEVSAASRSGQWDDEIATVTARLSNGVLAAAVFAVHTGKTNEVEVYGRDGSLSFSYYRFDSFQHVAGASSLDGIRVRLREMVRTLHEVPRGLLRLRQGGDFLGSFQAEWRHFFSAIRHDSPIECTLEDGRHALQVFLAAAQSASSGHPVKVAEMSES